MLRKPVTSVMCGAKERGRFAGNVVAIAFHTSEIDFIKPLFTLWLSKV